jgi:hypothetical protein
MCKPVSAQCITSNSEITDPNILKANHYRKATDDIDDLIGVDCADELCNALKQAVLDLEEYNELNPDGPEKTIDDFLADKWLNVVNNRHFQKWYSNRLLWHWLHGASTSELTASGLVTFNNSDDSYKNNFNQAVEEERKRMEDSADFYASQARFKFISTFWNVNTSNYDCIVSECGCSKTYTCQDHCTPPRTGIRMIVQ